MAPANYISCPGCGQLFWNDDAAEMMEFINHNCDDHTCGYDDCVDGSECECSMFGLGEVENV